MMTKTLTKNEINENNQQIVDKLNVKQLDSDCVNSDLIGKIKKELKKIFFLFRDIAALRQSSFF